MARGKHGVSAAARKVVGERDAQIAAYQHNIQKLTTEVAALKTRLDEQQKSHNQTVQVLKVQRDEGLSPTLAVLQKENVKLKEQADRAQRECREITANWKAAGLRMAGHFKAAHGLTTDAALEELMRLIGGVTAFQMPLAGEVHEITAQKARPLFQRAERAE